MKSVHFCSIVSFPKFCARILHIYTLCNTQQYTLCLRADTRSMLLIDGTVLFVGIFVSLIFWNVDDNDKRAS